MGVINPEGSQLNQPSCPRAKKNPPGGPGERASRLPLTGCRMQDAGWRGGSKGVSQSPGLGWGGGGDHLAECGTRPGQTEEQRYLLCIVCSVSENTPRICFKCMACSQLGPGLGGWGTSEVRGEGARPVRGVRAAHSLHPPHSPRPTPRFPSPPAWPVYNVPLFRLSSVAQMSLPLTREREPTLPNSTEFIYMRFGSVSCFLILVI